MAQPGTIKFGKMKVELGDGESPEVFAAPCGFTQKAFSRNKSLNEVAIPDCDDPDAAVVLGTDVATIGWAVTGEGVLAAESIALWDSFYDSTESRNVKITLEFDAPTGSIVYVGKAHLESFEINGQLGSRVTASISLRGDGALDRTPSI